MLDKKNEIINNENIAIDGGILMLRSKKAKITSPKKD